MYKSFIENDLLLALTVAFASVLFVVGVIAHALRWAVPTHKYKSNAHPPFAELI